MDIGADLDLRNAAPRLSAALHAMDNLHQLSAAASTQADLDHLLEAALDAAIAFNGADFGNIQLFDPATQALHIATYRGFDAAFLEHFALVSADDSSACGRALAGRRPIAIGDATLDPAFAPHMAIVRETGFRGVLSTPMMSAAGRPLGMISTHYREARAFAADEIWFATVLTREVSHAIDRARVELALRESEERLAMVLQTLPVGVAVVDPSGRTLMANDEMGRYMPTGLIPSRDPARGALWRGFDAKGQPVRPEDFPTARALRGESVVPGIDMLYAGDGAEEIWTRVASAPMHGRDGKVVGAFSLVLDIDSMKRSETRQATLLRELQHRVRNILAMVRAVARRTAEGGDSVEDVAALLDGRINALARTQTLIANAPGVGVDLEMLIGEELLSQSAEDHKIVVEGPTVMLSHKAAEVLTLAIHELATNATKHGCIGQGGSLSVTWTIEPRAGGPDWLRLIWTERGVQVISGAPRRPGFGTEQIERRVPYELDGDGEVRLLPGGLEAEIAFPLVPGESILSPAPPPEGA